MRAAFTIKQKTVNERGFIYKTFLVRGWLNGRRIRKQFQSYDEAAGEKTRLEVEAANHESETRTLNTRLTPAQVAEAEAAFRRLAGQSLALAVEWFLANYRPPTVEKAIEPALAMFRADRAAVVSRAVVADYRKLSVVLSRAFPGRALHTIKTEELQALSKGAKKTQNNFRGNVHAFFEFCRHDSRRWVTVNPAKGLPRYDIARGLPEILPVDTVRKLFAFLENYDGPPRSKQRPGYLVPYFALATFAGIRPSVRNGELWKIHEAAAKSTIIDLALSVIRLAPALTKTNDLRAITIQPNLAAWLKKYPLEKYPLMIGAMQDHVHHVRKRFSLGHDVLRHTFVSMSVAAWKSIGATALEAGNSERIIKKHYLNLVTPTDAAAFWAIRPSHRAKRRPEIDSVSRPNNAQPSAIIGHEARPFDMHCAVKP